VTREGEPGRAYSAIQDRADGEAFVKRGREDRHQFRLIVAPEDAVEPLFVPPAAPGLTTVLPSVLPSALSRKRADAAPGVGTELGAARSEITTNVVPNNVHPSAPLSVLRPLVAARMPCRVSPWYLQQCCLRCMLASVPDRGALPGSWADTASCGWRRGIFAGAPCPVAKRLGT
jgi:hypothetical protein